MADKDRNPCRCIFSGLLMVLLLFTGGCAPAILAAGAGAGYYAGNKKAARKVDMFFQDLADSIRTSSRRTFGARQTEKKHSYTRGSGSVIELQKSTLHPDRVGRGGKVTVMITYAVMGASAEGIRVRESRELWQGSRRLSALRKETLTRKNGTWESTLVFRVPKTADKGTYEVIQYIVSGKTTLKAGETFQVR